MQVSPVQAAFSLVHQHCCQRSGGYYGNKDKWQIAEQKVVTLLTEGRLAGKAKHDPEHLANIGKISKVEEDPAEHKGKDCVKMAENPGDTLQHTKEQFFLQYQQKEIVKAPQDEVPAGAMP